MRKLVSILLALAMLMALVPAALAAEPYTLDIYWVGNGDNPEVREKVEAAINEHIEPMIGAHVVFHIVPWDDWKTEVVDILTDKAARKEAKMDLVFTADWEFYGDLVEAKALYPLGDLIEQHWPDITDSLSESFLNGIKIKGAIYGIPTNKELCVPQGFLVNKTAADAIGWDLEKDEIRTTADLEPWLKKYKEKYPARYPYLMDMSPAGRWTDEPWINDWSGLNQNAVAMRMAKKDDGEFDETVYSIFDTPEEEEHIRLMYKWVQEGLISKDNVNMTKAGAEEIFGSGDFLVFTQPLTGNDIKAVEMYTQCNKEANDDFEVTEIIMQPKYIVTAHTAGSMFSIPVNSQNPDKAMQYIQLMHTDDVLVNLMLFGVEGENYEKIDEARVNLTENPWYTVHAGAWTVGDVSLQYVLENEDPEKNAKLIEFAKDATETSSLGFRFNKKKLKDETDAVNEVITRLADPLLCGVVDPDDPECGIEALRAALKEAGIEKLVEAAQKQYEDWKASLK